HDVLRDPRLDAVCIPLAQLPGPRAVADIELARGVALHMPRELLQLDPEDALAFGCARRIDRQRLTCDDGRLGRQESALGFVDCTRYSIEPGRQMHDRRLAEPLVAFPPWRLREREVNLHLRAAVAEP